MPKYPLPSASSARASVLIVDDNPANLVALRAILEEGSWNLIEALTGEQALEHLEAGEFAVVLLDVEMPGISGFDTARQIRSGDKTRHTPIIFLTANDTDREQLEKAYSLGAVDFLVKPLLPIVLQAKVRGFVELYEARLAAKRHADQFRLLVQGTTEYAIFMLDPEGCVRTWNAGAERLKGYSAEEIIGQHFTRFYPQDAIDRGWPAHELEVARGAGQFEDEGWRIRKDGSRFWANVIITALRNEQGQLQGYSKVTRDLTARRQAEMNARCLAEETAARRAAEDNARLIQQERERLHVTLASIGDAVISTDAEGRVDFLNPIAEEFVGWPSKEASQRPLDEVFHIVNEGTRQPVENPALRALREGEIVGLANHTILIARNGKERAIDDSASPIRDATGKVVGSVLVFRDVGEQKQVEQFRNVRLAVTHALNEAATVDEGVKGVLQSVCEGLAWEVGLVWIVNESKNALECRYSWHRSNVPVAEFEEASCNYTFERGKGLPGRVWASREPAWILEITDDPSYPRFQSAKRFGLQSVFACPMTIGNETIGVIEFFTRQIRETNDALLETTGTVASAVAQFIRRTSALEEVRRREQELSDFFENATIGFHWLGPDGTILRANRAELTMLGYRAEEYVGHPIADFHAGQDVVSEMLQRLKTGEQLNEFPAQMRCKDGSVKDVLIDSSSLWKDGEFVHTRCFTRDVTEKKRAESQIRESEARLQAVLDNTPAIVYVVDAEGRFLFINRRWEAQFGLTLEQVAGKPLSSFFPPEVANQFLRNNRQVLRAGTPFEFEETVTSNGDRQTFISVKVPFSFGSSGISAICGISTDITARKRAEEALRDADRRKDEFLATLAHELRNPLAPVRNALQILKLPRVDAETRERSTAMMERQVEHLVRLVDDLLEVSRVMRGKITLRKERVELASIVARAVETVQPLIDTQGIRLSISLPTDTLPLEADPVRLTQVVGNLLTNAAKYTEANGSIRLSAERKGREAILRIRDTGIGIDPDVLPHIFDLFVQADHATTKAHGGLGIGLTLVKNICEMHGGTVEGHSEGLGKGSEFIVRLPLTTPLKDQVEGDRTRKPPQQSPAVSGFRLLVVDDNQDAADSLATLLRLQGHEVRVVYSGLAALESVENYVPDVVFLDLGMPGMDGYEVAQRLRKQPHLKRTVLAALTGWGQQDDRRRTAEAGFDHHLVKPLEPKAVENLLASIPADG